ncbi:MAG: hypothetical protein JRF07_04365 [Deltaproteobacteria bacterium]|jgi:hypothetical protein|nr:hypothetical protein [Deltaproteobacteria bacterium]
MLQSDLKKFQQQLANWVTDELERSQLPFQRLENDFQVITDNGEAIAEIVLWINRQSLITGSVILCPVHTDKIPEIRGLAVAKALGLGHFVIWGARDITIWKSTGPNPERYKNYPLPNAQKVVPEDFRRLLKRLLEDLKIVTVTTAISSTALPPHYFANLCLLTINDMLPLLAERTKRAAGGDRPDTWIEKTPREVAWKSIWRLLLLVWQDRIPSGLQPERLEQAMYYALADFSDSGLKNLKCRTVNPELGPKASIRLHHTAVRLRQLRWPQNDLQLTELCDLLLSQVASQTGMSSTLPPWPLTETAMLVNCHVTQPSRTIVVAPEPYLDGIALHTVADSCLTQPSLVNEISELGRTPQVSSILAFLDNDQTLNGQERAARRLRLRRVWPTRRFELPSNAPAFLWDCLHLIGLQKYPGDLQLQLPKTWYQMPGAELVLSVIVERYSLKALAEVGEYNFFWFSCPTEKELQKIKVYRAQDVVQIPVDFISGLTPGLIAICLYADPAVLKLLAQKSLDVISVGNQPENSGYPENGCHLFGLTKLGQHLWATCQPGRPLPNKNIIMTFRSAGMVVPNKTILNALCHTAQQYEDDAHSFEKLDQELAKLIGSLPELNVSRANSPPQSRERTTFAKDLVKNIIDTVFVEGKPQFPEQYLIRYFRPELEDYDLPGPLHILESFFDRLLLADEDQFRIEVSGVARADALILASHSGKYVFSLPKDSGILEEIVSAYRDDLQQLWETLLKQCRQQLFRRRAALKLAHRVWKQTNLPPPEVFQKK